MRPKSQTVEQAIAGAVGNLLPREGKCLLACSGGGDSVALTAGVAGCGMIQAVVGHVDHGLRPESATEAARVRDLSARLGLPFYMERLEGLPLEGGLEAAAREARYAALARLARQAGASTVVTAHTRRDQAETLLLRLIRGAGPAALSGIRPRRELAPGLQLVRPLLEVSREETEAYCARQGLPFVTDPHNADPRRARAKLRALWPQLLELNPRVEEALARAAESFAESDLRRQALLAAANEAGVRPERLHLAELEKLIERAEGTLDLPGGRADLRDGQLSFHAGKRPRKGPLPEVAIPGPGDYALGSRMLHVSTEGTQVDLRLAPLPWTLRGHKPGDRLRPAGGKLKKVADLWIDARIPRELRAGLAVLADASGTVFFAEGLRPSEACRSAPGSVGFKLRPEMDGEDGSLAGRRQGESRSATLDPTPDEEPR